MAKGNGHSARRDDGIGAGVDQGVYCRTQDHVVAFNVVKDLHRHLQRELTTTLPEHRAFALDSISASERVLQWLLLDGEKHVGEARWRELVGLDAAGAARIRRGDQTASAGRAADASRWHRDPAWGSFFDCNDADAARRAEQLAEAHVVLDMLDDGIFPNGNVAGAEGEVERMRSSLTDVLELLWMLVSGLVGNEGRDELLARAYLREGRRDLAAKDDIVPEAVLRVIAGEAS